MKNKTNHPDELMLKIFTFEMLKTVLKIVKPWRIRPRDGSSKVKSISFVYADGWNDCIKEMNRNTEKCIKKLKKTTCS